MKAAAWIAIGASTPPIILNYPVGGTTTDQYQILQSELNNLNYNIQHPAGGTTSTTGVTTISGLGDLLTYNWNNSRDYNYWRYMANQAINTNNASVEFSLWFNNLPAGTGAVTATVLPGGVATQTTPDLGAAEVQFATMKGWIKPIAPPTDSQIASMTSTTTASFTGEEVHWQHFR